MANIGEVDAKKLKRIYEDTHVEWRIAGFISIIEYDGSGRNYYDSSTFSVEGVPFFFRMYPRISYHPESVAICLQSSIQREFSVEYDFGLKKLDGSVEQLRSGTMTGSEIQADAYSAVDVSEVVKKKSELMPNGVLTVTCKLRSNIPLSSETCMFDKPKELKLIRLEELSENFMDLFDNKESCDVILNVKGKEYKAHKSVLIARSSVFAANFKHDTLERQTGVITIPDCDPDTFQYFLKYLYCGKLEELPVHHAMNLYYTSDKYNVEEMKAFCVDVLINYLTAENICDIIVFADEHDENNLFSKCQELFNENVREILATSEWECLLKKDYRLANKILIEMSKVKH